MRTASRISRVAILALGLAALMPAATNAADPRNIRVSLVRVASGLVNPVAIAAPNDGTSRLFIVEQDGRIRVRTRSGLVTRPYLDIRSRVLAGGERGLLGLAFHPRFASNGFFFVHYTNSTGDVRISRFHATPSSNVASASTEVGYLTIPHRTFGNHNGGQVAFGPDGYFYAGIGDGGGAGDPSANAQNLSVLLGKIIRIDVNRSCSGKRYCIPSGNPFIGSTSRAQEIWHYGLRNPWRFSFDRKYGGMWIGDVGQGEREEIDTVASGGGRNFGWDCREGTFDTSTIYGGSYCPARAPQFQRPTFQYSHAGGRCAIIGGYRYRGRLYPAMAGLYFYGDYCTGEMWALAGTTNAKVYDHPRAITSFGESAGAELFVVDTGGNMYRVTARAA